MNKSQEQLFHSINKVRSSSEWVTKERERLAGAINLFNESKTQESFENLTQCMNAYVFSSDSILPCIQEFCNVSKNILQESIEGLEKIQKSHDEIVNDYINIKIELDKLRNRCQLQS